MWAFGDVLLHLGVTQVIHVLCSHTAETIFVPSSGTYIPNARGFDTQGGQKPDSCCKEGDLVQVEGLHGQHLVQFGSCRDRI